MLFTKSRSTPLYVSRTDPLSLLSSYSKHSIELDGDLWPSVEHYYQAMKFAPGGLRNAILEADHPAKAEKIAKKHKKAERKDWKQVKKIFMTRGLYIKCCTHPEVSEALLATGDQVIVEQAQYDYYWGCGRDGRGNNAYGKVLMEVRGKLREEIL